MKQNSIIVEHDEVRYSTKGCAVICFEAVELMLNELPELVKLRVSDSFQVEAIQLHTYTAGSSWQVGNNAKMHEIATAYGLYPRAHMYFGLERLFNSVIPDEGRSFSIWLTMEKVK